MEHAAALRILAVLCVLHGGCAVRRSKATPAAIANPGAGGYFDLEPGWRLRVITPILRSGRFQLAAVPQESAGNTLTLRTGDEFLGYETAYYSVVPRRGEGVKLEFLAAEQMREGVAAASGRPLVPLFKIPRRIRHVRLVQLQRATDRNHQMAIVGARRRSDLDVLTATVRTLPDDRCAAAKDRYCAWVPAGIAVRPERRSGAPGVGEWRPVR